MNIGDILGENRLIQLLTAHTKIGVAVILSLCTISGGLFYYGYLGGGLILTAGLSVIFLGVWMDFRKESSCPPHLGWKGFVLNCPAWLTKENQRVLETLARGALLLLEFDRTNSGSWGKSYLYRRFKSSKSDEPSLPLAGGSLTGIPVVLIAVGSSTALPNSKLYSWAFERLSATLAAILTEKGEYRMGYRMGTTGEVMVPEPLRHAAGGFFASLLQGRLDSRNLATLEALCTSLPGDSAWDQAIVARALLQALREPFFPRKVRRIARRKYVDILWGLVETAKRQPVGALLWADPIKHTTSVTIQWATVWALLPCIVDPLTPQSLKKSLRQAVLVLLLAQDNKAQRLRANADRMSVDAISDGQHAFRTAIVTLCWNFICAYPDGSSEEVELNQKHAQEATGRLIAEWSDLLEQPSCFDATNPTSLEGYFAWAALLLAVASTGTILPERDVSNIFDAASAMRRIDIGASDEKHLEDEFLTCINEYLSNRRTSEVVARSATKIAILYREIASIEDARAA